MFRNDRPSGFEIWESRNPGNPGIQGRGGVVKGKFYRLITKPKIKITVCIFKEK